MNRGRELVTGKLLDQLLDLSREGVDEWAIRFESVEDVIDLLADSGLAVLGADFWLKTGDELEFAGDAWAMRPRSQESWSSYVEAARAGAKQAMRQRRRNINPDSAMVVPISVDEQQYERLPKALGSE